MVQSLRGDSVSFLVSFPLVRSSPLGIEGVTLIAMESSSGSILLSSREMSDGNHSCTMKKVKAIAIEAQAAF